MSLTKRQEAYCQNRAEGLDGLDAMADAGYKASSKANAERQLKNLDDNNEIQNRITELRAINLLESGETVEGETAEVVKLVNALHFFETVYKDPSRSMKDRIACAAIAIQYEEPKPAAIGKKEQSKIDAKTATNTGKFATLNNQPDLYTSKTTQ